MKKLKIKPNIGKLSLILIGVIALLIAADLVTKYLADTYYWHKIIIPDFIEITSHIHNNGIAFSLFSNVPPEILQPILITFTFILLAFVAFVFVVFPERFVILKVSSSLVIAGAIGNLVDRIMLYEVRDWLRLSIFGTCNLADCFIVIGAILAVVDLMFLNEWAVFPLTKKAKEVQAAKKLAEEEAEKSENMVTKTAETAENIQTDDTAKTDAEQTVTKEDNEN